MAKLLSSMLLNAIALALAMSIGVTLSAVVVYEHGFQPGPERIVPFLRAALVTIILAFIAPRTGFRTRLLVFVFIYALDLTLAIVAAAATVKLVATVFQGDSEAAKPWIYGGAVLPFITGSVGYFLLQRYRRAPTDQNLSET